jgi:N-acetylglutamate synthase-like GNAT family acetyltransferase
MAVEVRPATCADAEGIVHVHFAAVHETAGAFYPSDVLANWSGQPEGIRYRQLRDAIAEGEELFLVGEDSSGVVGFGSIFPASEELRAVYVHPRVGRQGVGTKILQGLEAMAAEHGLSQLQMDASVNAEAFYKKHGYEVVERSVHRLSSGHDMACVKMRKALTRRAT